MVGLSFGKALALARGLPLIAVNHLEGHAVSARLAADVAYPFLLLLVSGGHCQLLEVAGVGACRRLGSTIDDAAGEAFDKIAKALGLPYPGGPALERLAEGGDAGALPAAARPAGPRRLRLLVLGPEDRRRAAGRGRHRARPSAATSPPPSRPPSPASWPSARDARHGAPMLRSMTAQHPALRGRRRRRRQRARCGRRWRRAATANGFSFAAPPLNYCTDNAAMIALAGAERLAAGPRRRPGRRRPAALAAGRGGGAGQSRPTSPAARGPRHEAGARGRASAAAPGARRWPRSAPRAGLEPLLWAREAEVVGEHQRSAREPAVPARRRARSGRCARPTDLADLGGMRPHPGRGAGPASARGAARVRAACAARPAGRALRQGHRAGLAEADDARCWPRPCRDARPRCCPAPASPARWRAACRPPSPWPAPDAALGQGAGRGDRHARPSAPTSPPT